MQITIIISRQDKPYNQNPTFCLKGSPSSRTIVENKVGRPTISSHSVPLPVYSSSSSGASAWGGGPAALGGSSSGTESSSIRERD